MVTKTTLNKMKKSELIELCIKHNINNYENLNKPNIVELILDYQLNELQSPTSNELNAITSLLNIDNQQEWNFNSKSTNCKDCKKNSKSKQYKKRKIDNITPISSGPEKLILAENYIRGMDVIGWYMSEKIDGIRAYWDGSKLWSRTGKQINPPSCFIENFPTDVTLDGELFMDQIIKQNSTESLFSKVCSITRKKKPIESEWKDIRFYVFDTVNKIYNCIERIKIINKLPKISNIVILNQISIENIQQLNQFHDCIRKQGGEGVMIKNPLGMYIGRRSKNLLKVKHFYDTEVKIINHKPGTGKYVDMLGGYDCVMVNGNKITVGSGMNDDERSNPLPIGTFITIKYFELTTKNHVPRFPVFLRKAERQEFSSGSIPGC